ncbi:hypothetical protein SRHO_G00083360 [Serrasalmus rhombeus]
MNSNSVHHEETMAPKKPPTTQREYTNNSEEECELSSAQRPTESASKIANLQQMLQGFIDAQQRKDEEQQREERRQDLRWRSLQHHFGLLQEDVRRGPTTTAAQSRIYSPVVPANETEGEHWLDGQEQTGLFI